MMSGGMGEEAGDISSFSVEGPVEEAPPRALFGLLSSR